MSGALAPEDIGPTRLKPPSNQTRAALSKIAREADHAKTVAKAKARRDAAQEEATTELDQIPSSIPAEPVPASKSSVSGTGNSSAIKGARMGLGSRIGETPRLQPPMLGATFKKRARQPSLLQMLQIQNDPSDDMDDEGLDDFRPDDESTPMIKSMLQSNGHTSSSSRQTSGSRKRKLATPEIQVPASQTQDPPSSPPPILPQEQEDVYDLPAEEEEGRPEPTLPRPRAAQTPQPQIHSDTLAPPQSSSPEKRRARKPHNKTTKAATRSQQPKRKNLSPAPSPLSSASTNTSPVKHIPPKPLATATLQNLLPRRRPRPKPRGEYDIPSSSDIEFDSTALGEDEDELSFHAMPKMRRKKHHPVVQKRGGKAKEAPAVGKRVPKTYAKKTAVESEDENENVDYDNDDDDAGEEVEDENGAVGGGRGGRKTAALDGRAKDEMKRLADKFREVDEYALDFEDMTANSSSQMKDAR